MEELSIPSVVAITGNAIGGGVAVSSSQQLAASLNPITWRQGSLPSLQRAFSFQNHISCELLRSLNCTERVIAQNGSAAFGNISRGQPESHRRF